MAKYIKKPVVIEAYEYSGDPRNPGWPEKWLTEEHRFAPDFETHDVNILITTLEGIMKGKKGDWIIKGISGEFYPIKNEIFKKTYALVE